MSRWDRFRTMLADEPLPAAIVDLDAVDANLALLVAAARGTPIRVATKSIRVPWMYRYLLDKPGIAGLMAYSAHEIARLASLGFDDFLLAYPPARKDEAAALHRAAQDRRVVALIDDEAHLALLRGSGLSVGIDVDGSWRPGGLHVGVRRSPIRTPEAAVALARKARDNGLSVVAVMCYEAQVAGMRDHGEQRWMDPVKRWLKARSRPHVASLRREVVAALRADGFEIRIVNGGGTGSVATTATDGSVTEVTAGSGFFAPHLFDGYDGLPLTPAAFFALAVARRSDEGFCTVAGGGVVASGEAGRDRLPRIWAPEGLVPVDLEGWGEVQTPFRATGAVPAIGDPVIARPAKAGEWLERFDAVLLVRGDRSVERAPTTRGYGWTFLS